MATGVCADCGDNAEKEVHDCGKCATHCTCEKPAEGAAAESGQQEQQPQSQ